MTAFETNIARRVIQASAMARYIANLHDRAGNRKRFAEHDGKYAKGIRRLMCVTGCSLPEAESAVRQKYLKTYDLRW